MNISLLDVLSCGLAAMVILLLLSLNTGDRNNERLEENTYIEVVLENIVNDNEVAIKPPNKNYIHSLIVPSPLNNEIGLLSFDRETDSLNKYIYFNQLTNNLLTNPTEQKLFIQLSNGAKKFKLKFRFNKIYAAKTGTIKLNVTKTATGKSKLYELNSFSSSINLELYYNQGIKMSIDTMSNSNPIFISF